MRTKTKFGIIGLGGVAQLIHLPLLAKMEDVVIHSAAEINKSRLKSVTEKFSIKNTFTSYEDMLAAGDIDAVIIATPTSTHRDIALRCIETKIPVLIEKPIAINYDDAKAIVDASKEHNVKVMVGMNMRYRPDVMLLKSIITSDELGSPFHVKCSWLKGQSSESKWFTNRKESGGGVIFDLGIVILDLALWLLEFPEIISVSTQNYRNDNSSVENASFSLIRCKPNSTIYLETGWDMGFEKDHFLFEIYGSKGSATLNPLRIFKKVDNSFIDLSPTRQENSVALYKRSYFAELKHFIGAIKGLNPLMSPAIESLSRMKLINVMYQSSNNNKEMKVEL